MKAKLFAALLTMTLTLFGCATGGLSPEKNLCSIREFMASQGKPPAYVEGYIDGCSTGRRMAGDKRYNYRRNNVRLDKDTLYARGWQDGQINCRNEVLAEQQQAEYKRAEKQGVFMSVDKDRNRRVEAESRASEAEMREIWEQLKK